MRIGLYGIEDTKAEAFVHFFVAPSDGVAVRSFEDLVGDPQSNVSRHPEDYSLSRVCEVEQLGGEAVAGKVFLTSGSVIRALLAKE